MANIYTKETIEKLKIEMAKAGLNQTTLSKEVGMDPQRISQAFTRSSNTPALRHLIKIANYLGVEPTYEERTATGDLKKLRHVSDIALELSSDIVKDKSISISIRKKASELLNYLVSEGA